MNVELTQGSFPFTWLTFSKKDRILSLILCRRLRFCCWQNTGTLDLDTFRLLWYHCTSVVFKFVCYDWLFLLLLMVKIMFSLSINEWPECLMYFVFLFFFLFDRFSLHWNLEFSSFMTKVYFDTTMERSFQSTTENLMSSKTDCLSLIFHSIQGKSYYHLIGCIFNQWNV